MACYWGTRGGCAKLRWAALLITLAAAGALLGASLYRTIPGAVKCVQCIQRARDLGSLLAGAGDVSQLTVADAEALLARQGPAACWNRFWGSYQVPFILSIVGAVCLAVSLLTCCCFCCAERPVPRQAAYQQAGYPSDQFVVNTYPDAYQDAGAYHEQHLPAPYNPGLPAPPKQVVRY